MGPSAGFPLVCVLGKLVPPETPHPCSPVRAWVDWRHFLPPAGGSRSGQALSPPLGGRAVEGASRPVPECGLPCSAVPWAAAGQEAAGDAAGVAGQPAPGQDPLRRRPRLGQQQDAGEAAPSTSLGDPAPALGRCAAGLPPRFCRPVSTATSSYLCLGLGQTADRDDGGFVRQCSIRVCFLF